MSPSSRDPRTSRADPKGRAGPGSPRNRGGRGADFVGWGGAPNIPEENGGSGRGGLPPLAVERYFERREIREAIAFAEAGGIAVHRNFDSYDGRLSPRGLAMRKPFVHVIGLRPHLEEWGRRHGLRPEWIQPEKRRRVAHYDAFGAFAQALIDRLTGDGLRSDASRQDAL